ncbi:MAG TPA: MauE/DoxX family redox-associated membrane protein [Acidimicrobiales bacterium]|nr:MauE/DoxX family redox-associated membrane protein [Acidimicrobiales bacterium]
MPARLAVGVVLLVAGVAKLADRSHPAMAVTEVVLGALLVTGVGGRWTAGAAAVLLAAFTVVVARRVRAGDREPCGCFGRLSRRPVTGRTVARNVALLALAVAGMLI